MVVTAGRVADGPFVDGPECDVVVGPFAVGPLCVVVVVGPLRGADVVVLGAPEACGAGLACGCAAGRVGAGCGAGRAGGGGGAGFLLLLLVV